MNHDKIFPMMPEAAADVAPGTRHRVQRRPQAGADRMSEAVWLRRTGMVMEMGWLVAAMTIQLYVSGATGYWIVCGMLVAYLLTFNARLELVSSTVWMLALMLALGSLGGMGWGGTGSNSVKDVWQPLHMGLIALAIMGGFAGKYHQRKDLAFLAPVIVGLLLVGMFQSAQRNHSLELWAEGQRVGVNLQALFLTIAIAYGFLLRGQWKLLVLPLYLALFWLGSRTGFITALAFPFLFFVIYKGARKNLPRLVGRICIALIALIAILNLMDVGQLMRDAGLPVAYQRIFDDTLKEGATGRQELSLFWLNYLWEYPTWFGNGIDSYGSRYGFNFPHNGYLHIFNGFGVVCGLVYFGMVIQVIRGLVLKSAVLPAHIAWAGAFVCTMLIRKFGEAQLLVEPTHIAGFAITYGVGLALWGVEHVQVDDGTRRRPLAGRVRPRRAD